MKKSTKKLFTLILFFTFGTMYAIRYCDIHDVNCNGVVNYEDIEAIYDAISDGYDFNADVNRDGYVNIDDVFDAYSCFYNYAGGCGITKPIEYQYPMKCKHDVNADGVVDNDDVLAVYEAQAEESDDPIFDINKDGLIDLEDVSEIYTCIANNGSCCLTTGC